ncbi:hypothetical protein EV643_12111 [Kribbella sp. VKM Ac-2527]|uniref:Uncharacterized protein n=1 Tax=Kribbella caucasensis TaxID=2512215 RepID=A0A4R6JI87_9ACTN|nr:hypothetical protein [Kribbella sp. VKM Ac-2527]TDO35739.1 hypothetical protein EV643_12111 [Kribbella sp. VKM Ac-2527]
MTRAFTAPRFQTAFDRVVEPLTLPGELRSGETPELTTVDQLVRGVAVIGRFIASAGLIGVKVRPTGHPLRVTAHFSFDSMSLEWWDERITTAGPGAVAPRLFVVRAQGRTRGAVLLIRPAAGFTRAATGVVSFDLRPEELTAEGLFVLEVVSIDEGRPAWAQAAVAGSIGIMLWAIEFTEVDGDREIGLASTGQLPVDPKSGTLPLSGEYYVANPNDGDEPRSWIARATVVEPLVPSPKAVPVVEPVVPVVEPVAPVAEQGVEPVESLPRASRGIKRRVKRGVRRAARWVVPLAAVPVARRLSKRAAVLERRVLRAAKRPSAGSASPVSAIPPTPPPPPPPPPTPPAPPGPPPNPLADAMADLVSRNLVQVELVGVEPGATPGVQVRAREDAEIEIVTDGPLTGPALIRLSIDPAVLREVPGVDDRTVRWDLVVRAES